MYRTDVCPKPVFGPSSKKRLGKPTGQIPRKAFGFSVYNFDPSAPFLPTTSNRSCFGTLSLTTKWIKGYVCLKKYKLKKAETLKSRGKYQNIKRYARNLPTTLNFKSLFIDCNNFVSDHLHVRSSQGAVPTTRDGDSFAPRRVGRSDLLTQLWIFHLGINLSNEYFSS